MGLCIINIASFFYIDKQFEKVDYINCLVKVLSIKEENEYTNEYIVKILNSDKKCNIKNSQIIIYTEKDINLFPGDIINVNGEFSKPLGKRNFGGFDYNNYLKQFKIFGTVKAEKIEKIGEEKCVSCYFQNIRKSFLDKIDILYKNEHSGFLKSLLFGKVDGLSEEIKENFRDSSISHVLAISGMHVAYVIIGLKAIFDKIIKNKKIKNYILICCLIIFSNLTGNSVSGIRACIMSSMVCLASNFEKKNNFYFSFIYSFIIIIMYNPYNIYSIGLWLSYMGTLGIVCFSSFVKRYFEYKLKNNIRKNGFFSNIIKDKFIFKIVKNELVTKVANNKIISISIKNIFENFVITISAQVLIFPIIMYVFNTISISFFISNILISFFVGPILILGYISVFLSYIKNPFLKIIVWVEEMLIELIVEISKICATLPFSKIYVVTPNFVSIVFYYLIILFFVNAFYKKRIYILKLLISYKFMKKEIKKFKKSLLKKIIVLKKVNYFNKNTIVILLIICAIFTSCFILKNKTMLEINLVDVGQGDCTYIKTPNGKNILIDGGEGNTGKYDYGKNVVLPYLLDKKVKKIDVLIATHADSDHIGGLFAVIENLRVENIIIGIQPEVSEQYLDLLKISEDKKVNIITLEAGNRIKIEDDIFCEVLWPMKDKLIEENALNNNSLVFKFMYKGFSCLFTGDIEEIAEKQIIEEYGNLDILKSTVLKVAHHGSKTSSINSFLKKVNPKIALIGVGIDNKFGHPNDEVIDRLKKIDTKIYRTDKNGEINIFVNDNGKINIKSLY